MKLNITPTTTAHALSEILAKARASRYTHASDGVSVVPLTKLDTSKHAEYELGVKLRGRPFEQRPLAQGESLTDAAPIKETEPKTKAKKVKAKKTKSAKGKAKKDSTPIGTGFVAFIDKLLTETEGDKVDGFVRSVYSVDEALKEVMRKFPDKNPTSVKKIIKVRPRHLERRKDGVYDDAKTRAPRWLVVGPGKNGSMTEIDTMFGKGKTVKEIVDFLVTVHGRDAAKATEVVQSRIEILRERAKEARHAAKKAAVN